MVFRCGHSKRLGEEVTSCDCKECPYYDDEEPLPPPVPEAFTTRHLLYHVWPHEADGGAMWRWNVGELRKRLGLFNGRKVIAVATGDAASPDAVRAELAGCGCEFVEVPNRPDLREVATFEALFSRVAEFTGPEHATFYAHAKGVANQTWHAGGTIREWAGAMYESCLDWRGDVAKALRTHPVVGSFKRTIHGWNAHESASDWHYSGSFFWFRNRDLFSQPDWRRIDSFYSGIEPYASLHFPSSHAATLVCENGRMGSWLYLRDDWNRVAAGPLAEGRRRNAGPSRLNLIYHCTPLAGASGGTTLHRSHGALPCSTASGLSPLSRGTGASRSGR